MKGQLLSLLETIQQQYSGKRQKKKNQPRWRQIIPEPQKDKQLPLNLQQALEKSKHEGRAGQQNHNPSVALI